MEDTEPISSNTYLPFSRTKKDCTGCCACVAACPLSCIAMKPNDEGFLFPIIDLSICTDCGICRNICPVNLQRSYSTNPAFREHKSRPLEVFAGWHLDELVREASSSGGLFTALADNILDRGGLVVGVALDHHLIAKHIIIESHDDLHRLRGSKYVQSEISPALYENIRTFLDQDRTVLFSGTPCQVAGVRAFLKQPTEHFYCCDFICHGVPSPLLFERYISHVSSKDNRLVNICFRDKTTGWKTFGIRQHYQNGSNRFLPMWDDPYMVTFLRNYALRPSCYSCKFKGIPYFSDLTIADFWGVGNNYPEYDCDDKGTSLLLVNNEKGKALIEACRLNLFLGPADLDTAIAGNPGLIRSCIRPVQRDTFFINLEVLSFSSLIRKYSLNPPTFFHRVLVSTKRRLSLILKYLIHARSVTDST